LECQDLHIIGALPHQLIGNVVVEAPCNLGSAQLFGNVEVGAFTYFSYGVTVEHGTIGRFCSIGPQVMIGPGQHLTADLTTHPFAVDVLDESTGLAVSPAYKALLGSRRGRSMGSAARKPALIGHDVWIGARAIIMGGVEIGTGAIIGAGAIVTRDVPPYAVVGGSPARVIRYRLPPEVAARALASRWWEWDLSPLTADIDYSDVPAALRLIEHASARGRLKRLSPARFLVGGAVPQAVSGVK
jgi:acetyltransferase-like isoleucine patch superfamily enzyme